MDDKLPPRSDPGPDLRKRAAVRIDQDIRLGIWTQLDGDDVAMAGELLARFWSLGVDAGIDVDDWALVTSLPVGILDALTVARRRQAWS